MLLLDTFRCFARRSQGMSRERIVHTFLVNGFWGRGYYVRFCKLFSRAISIVIEYIIVNVKKKRRKKRKIARIDRMLNKNGEKWHDI